MPDRQRHGRLSGPSQGGPASGRPEGGAGYGAEHGTEYGAEYDAEAGRWYGEPDRTGDAESGGWYGEPRRRDVPGAGSGGQSGGTESGGWFGESRRQDGSRAGYDDQSFGESPQPDDPSAMTMELGRVAWDDYGSQVREPERPDPMADTTLLRPLNFSEPTAEDADPDDGPTIDLGADTESAEQAEPIGPATPTPRRATRATDSTRATGPNRSLFERHRRRFAMGAAGIAAVCALLTLPPVRAQLRDSFTKLPQPYTALYFTSPPQVDGTILTVPVSVHAVDTGTDAYTVRVWTVDGKGAVDDSRTADLKWDGQAMSAVVSMPVNPAADYVWVSLNGSDESLHYKIAVS